MPNPATGLNYHEAINFVLESVGEYPVSDPGSGSYSGIALRAVTFLGREIERTQSQGWPDNTLVSYKATSGAVPSNTLSLRASGPDAHRTLTLRTASGGGQEIHDMNTNTTVSADVYIDAVVLIDWEDMSPKLRDVVVAAASVAMQRRILGNRSGDNFLMQEYATAEVRADRNNPRAELQLPNIQPQIPGMGATEPRQEQE